MKMNMQKITAGACNALSVLTLLLMIASMCPLQLRANDDVDIYELTLDENLETPEIKNKKHVQRIQDYQSQEAERLASVKGVNYTVELMRNGEVIIVSVPSSVLFADNDTVLSDVAAKQLKPLMQELKNPGFYKVMLVMHSDNTGSESYNKDLTVKRVNAVYDWIDAHGKVDFVVPYAMGQYDPITDNNSMENRRKNRRLEIFLVPGDVMLEQAKKGKININNIPKK